MSCLQVSIQSVFRQCAETKRNLIPTLVKNKNITPDIILHYCRQVNYSLFFLVIVYKACFFFILFLIDWCFTPFRLTYCIVFIFFCSTFGLDSYSAINLYITTLLLQEDRWYEMEIEEGDAALRVQESLRGKDDMLESALQIIPQLGSTKDLVISLNTALTKVCVAYLYSLKQCFILNSLFCVKPQSQPDLGTQHFFGTLKLL